MTSLLICVALTLGMAQTTPDEAVARGRESLDRGWSGYPWYDAKTDGVRQIDPPEIETPSPNAYSGPSPFWNILLEFMKYLLWVILAAVFVFLVFLLLRAYVFGRPGADAAGQNVSVDADQKRRIEALPFAVKTANLDLLAEARRYYEQGRLDEAIKYLFSHLLVELDRHRVVRLTKGKTNRQYLREIDARRRGALGRLFEQTMLVFEASFFGGHPVRPDRFEACWNRLAEFDALLQGGAS